MIALSPLALIALMVLSSAQPIIVPAAGVAIAYSISTGSL